MKVSYGHITIAASLSAVLATIHFAPNTENPDTPYYKKHLRNTISSSPQLSGYYMSNVFPKTKYDSWQKSGKNKFVKCISRDNIIMCLPFTR